MVLVRALQRFLVQLRPSIFQTVKPSMASEANVVETASVVAAVAPTPSNAEKRPADEEDSKKEEEPDTKKAKTEVEQEEKVKKVVKRKVALLLSYSGVGYYGMQRNPGPYPTIEEDLVKALLKTGSIPQDHARFMGKMSFQRCARTDKGVSAAGQVVSLKMLLLDSIVDKLNEQLPPQIRVMGIKRTTGSFNSKHNCDYRTYMYMLPTFAFQPVEQLTTENYRLPAEKIVEVNELLKQYLGTHNFHNFTSGKPFKDPSAMRHIKEFTLSEPFKEDYMEFAILRVRGQSFMLHQIRKMIGLILAIVKGIAHKSTLQKAFAEDKLDIPRAPGLGLMLEMVHYESYNNKWGNDGLHEPLTWEDCKEKMDAFKKSHIYPIIIEKEKREKAMMQWLSTLPLHTYDVQGKHNPMRSALEKLNEAKKAKLESDTSQSGEDSSQDGKTPANNSEMETKPIGTTVKPDSTRGKDEASEVSNAEKPDADKAQPPETSTTESVKSSETNTESAPVNDTKETDNDAKDDASQSVTSDLDKGSDQTSETEGVAR